MSLDDGSQRDDQGRLPAPSDPSTTTDLLEGRGEGERREQAGSPEGEGEPVRAPGDSSTVMKSGRTASELGKLSALKRRERKAEREAQADAKHLTFRQRLGVALSQLTQKELDELVKEMARRAGQGDARSIHALARLADQSFGRAQVEQPETDTDSADKLWQEMTPAERAAYRAELVKRVREHESASGDDSDPRT